ncbi:hypothetical protein AGMMS50249_2330 [candidate division SR1 bacterium]|nr:hypothetical protein AGMMS50249_2330 [candidate division SR1 bacterium]
MTARESFDLPSNKLNCLNGITEYVNKHNTIASPNEFKHRVSRVLCAECDNVGKECFQRSIIDVLTLKRVEKEKN